MAVWEGALEAVDMNFWSGKRVFITGHTGFKGSWLSLWLLQQGAEVYGYSLSPDTEPSLFEQLQLGTDLHHYLGDVRDFAALSEQILRARPDIVFHLAAQPLVRRSYREPAATWLINVQGTIHVLEALRSLDHPCAAVMITTDKCYENREWLYGYREEDPLGGYDPYSSSKAGAEIAISSWRRSFFDPLNTGVAVASARAGNVIGAGDWSEDRIVPDAIRALHRNLPVPIRNPKATRPWQHVLEPLGGYLTLAEQLYTAIRERSPDRLNRLSSAYNFGPALQANQSVLKLVEVMLKTWPGQWQDCSDPSALHEASLLNLVTDKAFHILNWQPKWDFETTVTRTTRGYQRLLGGDEPRTVLLDDILAYQQA